MSLSPKQGAIMLALQERGKLTLQDAVKLVGQDIYDNQAQHVGLILKRMIVRGLIVRAGRGVYELAPKTPVVTRPRGWWED